MTLRELLQTPLMKDAQVMAGSGGLENEVTWCVPDTALRFDNWIMPGLLLLYTGKQEGLSWREYIDAILKAMPSGVLLFGGKAATFVEEDGFPYFEEQNLPLIRMPRAANPLGFSKRFASVVASHFGIEHRREEWLQELCYSGSFPGGETIAETYGYCPEFHYYCLLVTPRKTEQLNPIQLEMDINSAGDLLTRELSIGGAKVLSFVDNLVLITFVPRPRGQSVKPLYEKMKAAVTRLCEDLSKCKWSASVGTVADSLSEFCTSYYNAQRTASVIASLKVHEKVSFYDDWYMHMLLLKEPKAELRVQMEQTLAPILTTPDLVETLSSYLTFGENLKVTSEKLYIHVNTLKYRLQRISDLLGCDLRDPNIRFRLRMAITIERYLRNSD